MTNSATKSAIVTGASGGIGGSIAKRLAKDGFSVVVNYAGKPAPAQAVAADIKAAGGQGIAVQADVAIATDVERLFKESIRSEEHTSELQSRGHLVCRLLLEKKKKK